MSRLLLIVSLSLAGCGGAYRIEAVDASGRTASITKSREN
jgi:hypothetical protein